VRQLETRLTPSLSALAAFVAPSGATPHAGLVMDGSGNLYGTAYAGGPSGDGTVFEVAKGSGTATALASFNGSNGAYPRAALIVDTHGNLYGTTAYGGAFNHGTVFELAAGSGTITTLASFDGSDGASPYGGLVMDGSGNLYGTTYGGGASNVGTVFELAAGSGTISSLASFDTTDGRFPYAGLILDGSGNLYGTTSSGGVGGAHSYGTVFELAHGSGTITTLASFDGTDGAEPFAGLTMDGSGNVYGTTFEGGPGWDPLNRLLEYGTVFEVAHGSFTITTLASFKHTNGANPYCALVMDSSSNLYGTTVNGGASIGGTVFEVAHGSGTITTLASFDGTDGSFPHGGLVFDGSGNLYGTTFGGGASNSGTVFEVAAGSGTITTLASFVTNGQNPDAAVLVDSSGNLYGTTQWGGSSGEGTVFEVAAGSGTITTLATFNGTNGANPDGVLIIDGSGNLYGTAQFGGASGDGTVFELAAGSGTITTLASFDGTDGAGPHGGVIMDKSGNLYGTTVNGGASNDGTVFEMAAGSGSITTLASFNGTDGATAYNGLVMDGGGNLYGATFYGGASNEGTVFEVAKGSGTITALASFDGTDGANSYGGLIMDKSGNLYGTTQWGGAW
jgi:uncharacterized repeat protein (TIGR03803 family)